ncbi:hypothetical protein [Rhodocyclus tenuis]|uniref:PGAP1-like alpha/beta domain-containing protein n=1 Tax=Rhodocyclus tenuis TaxID=1066 RepID=UPI001905D2F0|nr:hypothetical protein [Rhodocyclus tenuis]
MSPRQPVPSHPHTSSATPVGGSVSRTLKRGLQQTTRQVEAVHGAISATAFGLLRRIPFVGLPVRIAEGIHDTIAGGVYAVAHHGGGALLDVAASVEESALAPGAPTARRVGALRAALNAVAGDQLAARGNPLAIAMGFFCAGQRLPLDAGALAAMLADSFPARPAAALQRIVIFVHGFGCDENIWLGGSSADRVADSADTARAVSATALDPADTAAGGQPGIDAGIGERLADDLGLTSLYLRYNSGLPIEDNGRALGELLETLVAAWPARRPEVVLIGHSAGGLVARCACEAVDDAGEWPRWPWQRQARMLICLATPHGGAPLEKVADLATQALGLSPLTASLGRSASERRRRIDALRRDLAEPRPGAATRGIACRLLGTSLADDVEHPLGEWLGDGVVSLSGATHHPAPGDVASRRIGGVGHFALLQDERVYQQVREWIAALPQKAAPKATRRPRKAPAAAPAGG